MLLNPEFPFLPLTSAMKGGSWRSFIVSVVPYLGRFMKLNPSLARTISLPRDSLSKAMKTDIMNS